MGYPPALPGWQWKFDSSGATPHPPPCGSPSPQGRAKKPPSFSFSLGEKACPEPVRLSSANRSERSEEAHGKLREEAKGELRQGVAEGRGRMRGLFGPIEGPTGDTYSVDKGGFRRGTTCRPLSVCRWPVGRPSPTPTPPECGGGGGGAGPCAPDLFVARFLRIRERKISLDTGHQDGLQCAVKSPRPTPRGAPPAGGGTPAGRRIRGGHDVGFRKNAQSH